MKESLENPLGLKNEMYSIDEFGAAIRNKFGADSSVSNLMLGEIFLSKYPIYSCKIKKSKDYIARKSCGCC